MISIQHEEAGHTAGVRQVEEQAFGRAGEADLCDQLRERGAGTLSLVALEDGAVVGHVLFSPVTLTGAAEPLTVSGLGPVAVLPGRQRQGIGTRLIRAGLEEIRQQGWPAVVVMGSPRYYSRFGFEPASRYGIRFSDANVPAAHFMALELAPGALAGQGGVARYQPEFDSV